MISRQTIENISLQVFPEGENTISSGLIFKTENLEATNRLQISDVNKVHSRFNLSMYV